MSVDTARLLAGALKLASCGLRVFPLHTPTDTDGGCSCSKGKPCQRNAPGKHPRISDWKTEATTDVATISAWWKKWPDANIGIATGAQSGVVVFDIDSDTLGFKELEGFELGDGPTARTGNGVHVFYAHPGYMMNQKIAGQDKRWPFKHCDFKGDANYVVAPPSLHYNGSQYSWITEFMDAALPPVPDWLAQAHAGKLVLAVHDAPDPQDAPADHDGTHPRAEVVARILAQAIAKVQDGGTRNNTGTWLFMQLRDERVPSQDAPETARGWFTAVAGLGDHPYTWDEFIKTRDSIYSQPPRQPAYNGNGGIKKNSITWAAEQYRTRHADELRYVRAFRKWYVWNGMYWEPDPLQTPMRLGYEFVVDLYQQAGREPDDDKRKTLANAAMALDKFSPLTQMIELASALAPLDTQHAEFDQNDWQVVAANGVIDLRTGSILPHTREQMHTKRLGPTSDSIVYDRRAVCPNWLEFLNTILEGRTDDIAYLQRAIGYTLTGDTSEQCWFLLTGDGNNGKSTFTKVLMALLGTYGDGLPVTTLLSSSNDKIPNDIAKLIGVRGAFASESEDGRSLAEALVKQLTGGDPVTARFMRGEFFTFTPKLKLWMHTNHLPKIRGQDLGTWRRIKPIPFTYNVPADKVDRYLYERKLLPELPGILAWAMEGCLQWQTERTLGEPASIREALSTYREESDNVRQYVATCIVKEPDVFVRTSVLYEHYARWCRQTGDKPDNKRAFGMRISTLLGVQSEIKRIGKSAPTRVYPGLRVEDTSVEYGMITKLA